MFLCSVLERVLGEGGGGGGGGTAYRVQALLLAVVFNIGNRGRLGWVGLLGGSVFCTTCSSYCCVELVVLCYPYWYMYGTGSTCRDHLVSIFATPSETISIWHLLFT